MNKLAIATVALLDTFNFAAAAKCAEPALQQNFDAAEYAGKWYEIERSENLPFEKDAQCVLARYTVRDDGKLGVVNSQYDPKIGKRTKATAVATCEGA